MNPNLAGAIESDFAYDGDNVYVVVYNAPLLINPVNLRDVGNTFSGTPGAGPTNSTLCSRLRHWRDCLGTFLQQFRIPRGDNSKWRNGYRPAS